MNPLLKLADIRGSLFKLLKQDKGSCLFFFLAGLALRGIPELLVGQYPVGYETITWYAPIMTSFHGMSVVDVFAETFRSGPLFYVTMWFATAVSGANAFLLLKVAGPLLYGCLAVVFFVFLRRGLRLEWKMAFAASLLLVFQVAALRESWDRFRNVLGLIFVFAALSVLRNKVYRFKWPLVAGLAVLTVLSREYIGLVLFVVVFGSAFLERKDRLVSLVSLAPAFAIFAVMVYPAKLVSDYVLTGLYSSVSYLWTVQDALSIFAVCYLALLPFVLKGFRRDHALDPMVGLLLVGSFSVVIPRFALPGYQRWLMLLVFPFSIYAVWGFERFRLFDKEGFRKLVTVLLVFMVIGMGYSTGLFSYVGMVPNSYVAVNLVQSSITWSQVDDVKNVLQWLDENAPSNSSLLAEERFYGWTLIYLKRANNDVEVVPYSAASPPGEALENTLANGFSWVYLIWYADSNLTNFHAVYSWNSISVYQYEL